MEKGSFKNTEDLDTEKILKAQWMGWKKNFVSISLLVQVAS